MIAYVGPTLFALCVWWASTVAIIYLDNLPRATFKWSMLGATVVLAAALYGLMRAAQDTSTAGAYLGFTCGLLVWGWQEMSFYMGFVTGPRTEACRDDCRGWRRFVQGVETVLYHELVIILAAAAVVWLTWGGPNQVGTWTLMVLWWMHESAKLNVFFGVPNLSEELLPQHLDYLKSFLRKRPMNLLFPVSVTVSTVVAILLAEAAMSSGAGVAERAGYTFLTALMALAIVEHWVLVLPIPTGALWSPGLRARGDGKPHDLEAAAEDDTADVGGAPGTQRPDPRPAPAFFGLLAGGPNAAGRSAPMPRPPAASEDATDQPAVGEHRHHGADHRPTMSCGPIPVVAAE